MDEQKRDTLLFDDVNNFSRSKAYFGALQHLRLYGEWIQESLGNLQHLHDACANEISSYKDSLTWPEGDIDMLNKGFDQLLSNYKGMFESLSRRVKDKTDEITSLRDGVRSFPTVGVASLARE